MLLTSNQSKMIVFDESKRFNFKAKNYSNKGLNQKSASHKLLIQLWRIQKKYSFLVGVDLLELFKLKDVLLN
jgi:hypothetical protein